jgi:hypothetical protein
MDKRDWDGIYEMLSSNDHKQKVRLFSEMKDGTIYSIRRASDVPSGWGYMYFDAIQFDDDCPGFVPIITLDTISAEFFVSRGHQGFIKKESDGRYLFLDFDYDWKRKQRATEREAAMIEQEGEKDK